MMYIGKYRFLWQSLLARKTHCSPRRVLMMDFLGSLFPGNRSHLSQPLCNLTLDLFPQPLTTATHLCNVAGDIEIDL